MKKIVLAFLFSSGFLGLAVKCCSSSESFAYWKMNDFKVLITDNEGLNVISDSTNIDTLNLQITIDPIFLASQKNVLPLFVNSAYALSCPDPGELGLKDKLINLKITSDKEFENKIAGEDLREFCSFGNNSNGYSEFLNHMNSTSFTYSIDIKINKKPNQILPRKFKILFEFEDGTIKEKESNSFVWY